MPFSDELINELAELCGIIPEYWDIFGNKHITPTETKKAILRAMKLNIKTQEDIIKEIKKIRLYPWNRFVEPVKVVSINDQPLRIPVYIQIDEGKEQGSPKNRKIFGCNSHDLSISWSITDENGARDDFKLSGDEISIHDQQWIDERKYIKTELTDKGGRDIGYYTINIICKTPETEITGTSRIIITPDSCYMPQELENSKTWGLSINLYSIRSSQNWGVGDLSDLKKIVQWVSGLKGGFVGINPLHAIPNKKPFGISPYSPISRLYKNFIYLDIEDIPEVKELMAHGDGVPKKSKTFWGNSGVPKKSKTFWGNSEVQATLNELRKEDLIDHEKVASLKISVLRNAFEIFYKEHYLKGSIRCKDFRRYISEEGNNLESFATYMAISNSLGVTVWQQWPEEYWTPSSHTIQEFKKTHEKEILFYQYVQWLIDGQLKEAAKQTRDLEMSVGIYHDLAIGSIGGGSDAWNFQNIIAEGIDLGAPPDDFNPTGQNWGLPPLIPEKLKESGYDYFIQTIRKNMKHFGALRIDHALGMFRQFWIPKGMPASQGAYIKFPSEDLLRIIALESVRNKTMVIAEDLGTIGENVRETLFRFSMLSYRLLYFEKNYPDPSFLQPEKYPEIALCTVTTHDLPTIYGWWVGRDIEVKKRLGIFTDENTYKMHADNRERDKELLLNALMFHGLLEPSAFSLKPSEMTPELCLAIYEYLARTPCKLIAVSLDDAIGTLDQQNMPGITGSYPSWMQKTSMTLEQMISDKWFHSISEMFKRNNR